MKMFVVILESLYGLASSFYRFYTIGDGSHRADASLPAPVERVRETKTGYCYGLNWLTPLLTAEPDTELLYTVCTSLVNGIF